MLYSFIACLTCVLHVKQSVKLHTSHMFDLYLLEGQMAKTGVDRVIELAEAWIE